MMTPKLLDYMLNLIIGAVEFILSLRIILRLFGASSAAPFVNWIYETSSPLVAPFRGIFPQPRIEGFVIEFSTIFALFVYMLIGYMVSELIDFMQNGGPIKKKKAKSDE